MIMWLETWIRASVARYVGNERGQEWIVILLVLFLLWLLLTGSKVVVQ